ncbi:MAG: hypothetical protein EOO38_19395 [Cytophagaceae bacterium]|nr:MAG: hypothetical protein EOO38_19395 [Cytophagaceae bacterium]
MRKSRIFSIRNQLLGVAVGAERVPGSRALPYEAPRGLQKLNIPTKDTSALGILVSYMPDAQSIVPGN